MITWDKNTELVAICLHLTPEVDINLPANYTYGLLGWWLDRIRRDDPNLSAYLHDGGAEKPFTLSRLTGLPPAPPYRLLRGNSYQWTISALALPLCQWLATWLESLSQSPELIHLFGGSVEITAVTIASLPTTYRELWQTPLPQQRKFRLEFISPTSFRTRKHHLPLPVPSNIFHSYLRRWNDFSPYPYSQEEFLDWVTEMVFVSGHRIETTRLHAGKAGLVTGFTGWVEFGVEARSDRTPPHQHLLYNLIQLAPYCGTGHKTTFGLGQTQFVSGESLPEVAILKIPQLDISTLEISPNISPSPEQDTITRLSELTNLFFHQKKRQGGDRARHIAEIWATIFIRWEQGESLQDISIDLGIPYETVKTYAKRARKAINQGDNL